MTSIAQNTPATCSGGTLPHGVAIVSSEHWQFEQTDAIPLEQPSPSSGLAAIATAVIPGPCSDISMPPRRVLVSIPQD